MIHVSRVRVNEPDELKKQGAVGPKEREAVLKFYARSQNQGKAYRGYKAYAHRNVKARLKELFHDKCAYCEARAADGHDMDVEHFRPKNAVSINGTDKPPGYYWLAADWRNLLLSCQHCNQRRTYDMSGGTQRSGGKQTQFPLKSNSPRAAKPGEEDNEEPLLLNPCEVQDLHRHVEFDTTGSVTARTPEGQMSIDVYALWRPELVRSRAQRAHEIQGMVDELVKAYEEFRKCHEPGRKAALEQHVDTLMRVMRPFFAPGAPFVGVARSLTPGRFWPPVV